jgi:hypothetical protein
MANLGKQKWSNEAGGWVEDSGEEPEISELDEPSPAPPLAPRPPRPATRGFDSVTMQRFPQIAMLLLGAGILAIIILAVMMFNKPTSTAPAFQDLGPGVSNVAGLKGHLVTRWQKGVQYQLKFEPLFGIYNAGFTFTVGHPPEPLWVNIRLLDSTGYAVCGKQIEFQFNPAHTNIDISRAHKHGAKVVPVSAHSVGVPSSSARAQQKTAATTDSFQNVLGDDGQIASVYAQGILPCTEAQYKKFYYWDFSTNFPSLAQQEALMKAPAIAADRAAAVASAAQRQREARSPHYFVEGDAMVRDFNNSTATLESGAGQSFIVVKTTEYPTANSWAESSAQIHYKCDTLANCLLTRAGDGRIVNARSIP